MAYVGKPVTLTAGTNPGNTAPQPLIVVGGLPAATSTVNGGVKRIAAPAAAPVPFADLTAAANSFNALRTALISAGVLS